VGEQPAAVLHEDTDLLVVQKEAGQLVIPGRSVLSAASGGDPDREEDDERARPRGVAAAPTIKEALEQRGAGRLWVVHRLDRGTSGVLVFARNAEAHRALSRSFEGRGVEKTYWALCRGLLYGHGEVDRPLLPIRGGLVKALPPGVTDARAKASRTAWRAVERWGDFTQVEARPRTGRLHQIRAHLASLGHPLAVDPPYGGAPALHLADLWPAARSDEAPGALSEVVLARVPLHALRLVVPHPRTGATLRLEAPLPDDLARLIALLRRAAEARPRAT